MMASKENIEHKALLTQGYNDNVKGLNSYAFFKLSNTATGEEIVQETFLKTWKYLVRGGKIDVMRAFLYHILNNLIIDQYRKKKTGSLDILLEQGFEPKAENENNERLFNLLDGKEAILLISQLPAPYQKIMRMKYIQGLTIEEMALITGKTKNAVAVQAHRGLEKLKLLYKQ